MSVPERVTMSPVRKRPAKTRPSTPGEDVAAKQDPAHTRADFLRDLRKASSNRAKPLPIRPARSA